MSKARDLADSVAAGSVLADGVVSLSEVGGGTNNGVVFVNGGGTTTSGSALTFNGTNLGIGTSSPAAPIHTTSVGTTQAIFQSTGTSNLIAISDSTSINAYSNGVGSDGNTLYLRSNGLKRAYIDSSGNVGIGTTSPSAVLDIESTSATQLELKRSGSAGQIAAMIFKDGGDAQNRISSTSSNLAFGYSASNTEAMRITSAGNLLVGTTTTTGFGSTTGAQLRSNGGIFATVSGDQVIALSRTTSDGSIAEFYKNETMVGSIGSFNGMAYFASGDVGLRPNGATDAIYPTNGTGTARDSAVSFGDSGSRFKDLYLSGTAYINGITVGRGAGAVATNTAVGASALAANTSGYQNASFGYVALQANTTGYNNAAFGEEALAANTTGALNTGVGQETLRLNTTGSSNTAVGQAALRSNTTASNNTAVGYQAAYSNQTGSWQTAFGRSALSSATAGDFNVAIGGQAAGSQTTASNNTAIGHASLYNTTTASNNTAVGYQAAYSNTTGAILAIGHSAGYSNTVGNNSVYVGNSAGQFTTGSSNTFVGISAGENVTTGGKNTIIGRYNGNQGGLDIRTANNYIVLSDGDGNPRGIFDGSGRLMVGTTTLDNDGLSIKPRWSGGATTTQLFFNRANTTAAGIVLSFANAGTNVGSISHTNTATSYATSSDYRLKEDWVAVADASTRVNALKPVNFAWKVDGKRVDGFLAHEVAEVVPEAVTGEKDAVDAEGNPQYQGIDQSKLVPLLTAALQEALAQIESLTARVSALEGN